MYVGILLLTFEKLAIQVLCPEGGERGGTLLVAVAISNSFQTARLLVASCDWNLAFDWRLFV